MHSVPAWDTWRDHLKSIETKSKISDVRGLLCILKFRLSLLSELPAIKTNIEKL